MKISSDIKFFLGTIVVTVVILVGAIALFSQPAKEVSGEVLSGVNPWATGSAQPKATLVEFSDYTCPACKAAQPMVRQLLDQHQDQLQLIYRHFPLPAHPEANLAAQAAEAAGAQGKFWQIHELLFQNQDDLSKETINGLAVELKLDMDQFNQDLQQEKFKSKIETDLADGQQLGITSTPTFFLNGKKLNLFSISDLDKEVKEVLEQ